MVFRDLFGVVALPLRLLKESLLTYCMGAVDLPLLIAGMRLCH